MHISIYGGIILTDEEEKYVIEIEEESGEEKPVPWKSAIYSLVFPGLGQINNGDYGRGSFYFVIAFILIVSAYVIFTIPILIVFWVYNIYQAFSHARKLQSGTGE